MRRAIPILAAVLLGSGAGCVTRHCDFGTLTIYWTFTDAAGQPRGCADAGVSTVRVTIDGVADDWACQPFGDGVEGITYTDFTTSTHSVQVEGFDANSQLLYLYQASNVQTNGCGDAAIDANLTAIAGDLIIDYRFTDSAACPGNTYIWYELLDESNQMVDVVDGTHTPTAIPCGQMISLSQVSFGNYTVSRIQEVELLSGGAFRTYHATCDAQSVPHFTAGETVTVSVPASNGNCFF